MATQYSSHPPPLSPFESAFFTVSPFSAELLSLLSTSAKFNLFSCSYALSMFRDSCYTWQDVSLTKNGYEQMTSLKKVNYQIDARIRTALRLPVNENGELSVSQNKEKSLQESQIDRYFCPNLRDQNVWSLLNSRPGIGSVLSFLTLDGTNVTIKLVRDVAAKCAAEGYGLKYLSVRYCERIKFEEVCELFNIKSKQDDEDEDDEDSGFESSSEHGDSEQEDSTVRRVKTLQIYGVRDLTPHCTQLRTWYHTIEAFKNWCKSRNITTDIAWCSPSLPGSERLRKRSGCAGVREVPFCRVLPLADTASVRKLQCTTCAKTPEQLGYYCEGCLKDFLCEDCGTFVCDRCDSSRDRLMSCSDCSVRRCKPCFEKLGGGFCETKTCKKRATCGAHTRDLSCDNCSSTKTVSCAECNPTAKCHRCNGEIYVHCGGPAFQCDCDFELCKSCFEWSKDTYKSNELEEGSLEEMVGKLGNEGDEFPSIVPRVLPDDDSSVDEESEAWSCVWCRILPRRRERIIEQKMYQAVSATKSTKRTRRRY